MLLVVLAVMVMALVSWPLLSCVSRSHAVQMVVMEALNDHSEQCLNWLTVTTIYIRRKTLRYKEIYLVS